MAIVHMSLPGSNPKKFFACCPMVRCDCSKWKAIISDFIFNKKAQKRTNGQRAKRRCIIRLRLNTPSARGGLRGASLSPPLTVGLTGALKSQFNGF